MLTEVHIAGEASYPVTGEHLSDCRKINFIFGSNGSGKTTISRVICEPARFPSSKLVWKNGRELDALVYNSDFLAKNFTSSMPGIFTLGVESKDTVEELARLKVEESECLKTIDTLSASLHGADGNGGKKSEASALRSTVEASCWKIKQAHDEHFQGAFTGLRNSKTAFCDRVLTEYSSNSSELKSLEDLKTRAATVFSSALERHAAIQAPAFDDLLRLENSPILAKKVVGKDDVDIGALVRKLGNSDWVRDGRSFWDQSKPLCPFCQQEVKRDLTKSLDEFFDEAYLNDISEIDRILTSYRSCAENLSKQLEAILTLNSAFVKNDVLVVQAERFAAHANANVLSLERKRREPSAVVKLDELVAIVGEIRAILEAANASIAAHNALVENIGSEKKSLIGQIWKYLLEEHREMLDRHAKDKDALDKAIDGLEQGIAKKKEALQAARNKIAELERKITSVQPTVNEINAILKSFGFVNFKLETAGDKEEFYRIVRLDGSDACATLSEGEKGFITFLYFYHLIRGSVTASGVSADRIVVIDDPVSSLDSDVLFIVSTLIKRIIDDACDGSRTIKQVFVLTHNIYFHKEVSFDQRRRADCLAHESFWIVRKDNGVSALTRYGFNPIKTSYELLWGEVRNPERSRLIIQNTLRRIVENYFTILGNIDKNKIVAMFDGRDKQICGSLFSWVNDGSHSVYDDLYISADDGAMESYLRVFREVFVKSGHEGHYNMMMHISPDQSGASAEASTMMVAAQ